MAAGGANSFCRNQHARADDHAFVDRIAQRDIDKFAAADKPAPQIADRGEAGFNGGARVRSRLDPLLGHIEIELVQPPNVVIAGIIQGQVCMRVHEPGRERRIAQIDHLRAARGRHIAAYVDDLIALHDDDGILHERLRFPIEQSRGLERDDVVVRPDWDRAGGKRKDAENKPCLGSTTRKDIHSRDIEASGE